MKARWRGDGQDAAYIMAAQEKRERRAQKRRAKYVVYEVRDPALQRAGKNRRD